MDHLPISPFGQPIYGTPLSGQHAVHLDQIMPTLALTLDDESYKGSDGRLDLAQVGGLVDVLLYFDTKLSQPAFHAGVTDICQKFEDLKTHPENVAALQESLRLLGSQHPQIPHNQYIHILASFLSHIKEGLHEA